uniref:CBS domain-containing protein n=1 Tax=Fervidobacterium thailandense TaxID=1008305 RepID=A0A7C4CDH2_9BACT
MKVITTHINPDFDGFASCVGIKKLYPDFEIILSGSPVQNLKEFLRLYEEEFPYRTDSELKELNEEIEEVVIVDTNSLERISELLKLKITESTKITIIDHHPDIRPPENNECPSATKIVRTTGAATSIVVSLLREKGVRITKSEATLLAIAIYEDTGSLLFSSTTIEDVLAVTYLLENGANLETVAEYVRYDLTIDQKKILNDLLQNVTTHNVNGYIVTIAYAETEKFIGGLAAITAKFWYTYNAETLIVVVRMGKKVVIAGRTKSSDINLAGLMAEFGGGGHRQAASATLNLAAVDEVIHKILRLLPKHINTAIRARDIMSSPVRTVLASETIEEVNKIMETTGHGGLPVVEGNKLVGIVTKKSVDKAIHHGLGKRPVKSIMSSKLITARVDTPVSQIKKMMVENDIGRIPILDENNILVGIVTRSDVMRAMTGNVIPNVQNVTHEPVFENLLDLMKNRLPSRLMNLLRLLGTYGTELRMSVYVVGGFVRDLLLNIPNYDVDIVVEGTEEKAGIEFAKYVGKELNATVVPYEKFLTASIIFRDGYKIDIATARTEYYESPGDLPQVDISTIKKDLYRRDFTINAMAIKLNPQEFGTLYDFFSCRKDLENGIIRVLHNLSFVEDPTRMIRAIRFEQRYNFRMEERTLELLKKNLEENYLERVSGARIRQEIEKILEEKEPIKAFRRMAELGVLKRVFPKTYYTSLMDEKLSRLFKHLPQFKERFESVNDFYAVSTILLEYYDKDTLEEMRKKYGYPKRFIESLKMTENLILPLKSMVEERLHFSEIYKVLGKSTPYVYIHLSAYLEDSGVEYLLKYINALNTTKLETVTGRYLVEAYGLKQGPMLNRILEELYSLKLDNPNLDEISIVERIVQQLLS